jgi:hypothetical protein
MLITPQKLSETCEYSLTYILKLLTVSQCSGRMFLSENDLMKLYSNIQLPYNSKKLSLIESLENLLNIDSSERLIS